MGNWSEKKILLALFCIVCQYVVSTGTISNTSIYQPQSITAKLLIIQGHIKMRDDELYNNNNNNLFYFRQLRSISLKKQNKQKQRQEAHMYK